MLRIKFQVMLMMLLATGYVCAADTGGLQLAIEVDSGNGIVYLCLLIGIGLSLWGMVKVIRWRQARCSKDK